MINTFIIYNPNIVNGGVFFLIGMYHIIFFKVTKDLLGFIFFRQTLINTKKKFCHNFDNIVNLPKYQNL